jgi:RNase P subunit RPR2
MGKVKVFLPKEPIYRRVNCSLCTNLLPVHSTGIVRIRNSLGENFWLCKKCQRLLTRMDILRVKLCPDEEAPTQKRIVEI